MTSGKCAAQALLELDTNLAQFAASIDRDRWSRSAETVDFVQQNVMNTWTLTLAARCAGVSEQQVIAALLYSESLRIGSTSVCQGIAFKLFNGQPV